MQTKIPCILMRGGTSKGAYFLASDLPLDETLREKVLLSVMGSPDSRQIDGLGGANSLTSKVAIVQPSQRKGVDLDYLFTQVMVEKPKTSTLQNCGNILAGVGPFAVEQGLIRATDPETTLTIFMENSNGLADVTFNTPNGSVNYNGDASIDGVPGTASPVMISFRSTEGSTCGTLLPTGNLTDLVNGIDVTCIDNGMPVVLMDAKSLNKTGYESRDELNADDELKNKIETIRLEIGHSMNLGNVRDKTIPKMTIVAPPTDGGVISTRSFIPHDCHSSIGVLAAVSVGTATIIPGTVAHRVAKLSAEDTKLISVEHPTGAFAVEVELDENADNLTLKNAALLRTSRRLFEGLVSIPATIWDGKS